MRSQTQVFFGHNQLPCNFLLGGVFSYPAAERILMLFTELMAISFWLAPIALLGFIAYKVAQLVAAKKQQ